MAEMEARYRYRLRVNPSQAVALQAVFDANRFVWNTALGRWNDLWRYERERYTWIDACAELTDWRGRYGWLSAQPVAPQQQTLRDLGQAIAKFFDPKDPSGRPKFKRRDSGYSTARWTVRGFHIGGSGLGFVGDRLHISVAGGRYRTPLRVVWSRPLPSAPKSVTIYRDASGRWYASFVVRIEADNDPRVGKTTGVDVGLKVLATTTEAEYDVPNPRFGRRDERVLKKADRDLSLAQYGSLNHGKVQTARARKYATVKARRQDYANKTTRPIAQDFDVIGVEDLRIKNMMANRRLSRAIGDAGWGNWVRTLEWQARKAGHEVVRVNPRNTSQTCSDCGAKAKRHLDLNVRVFECEQCGLVLDRDRNAARNIDPGRAKPVKVMTAVRPDDPAGTTGSPSLKTAVLSG